VGLFRYTQITTKNVVIRAPAIPDMIHSAEENIRGKVDTPLKSVTKSLSSFMPQMAFEMERVGACQVSPRTDRRKYTVACKLDSKARRFNC